jgi:hypothetical protein
MRYLLVFLFLLLPGIALAQTADEVASRPDVQIRAYLEPDGDIYVGQLVRLWVEVTTSTWFTRAPRYPELQLDGAIVLMPEQLGVNFTDRVGGSTRSGQRQRYAIIPQRAGALVVPPLTVALGVSVNGQPSELFIIRTERLELMSILPQGTEGLDQIVAIPELLVEERYDRVLDGLKVGDAITRTVTLSGEDTFAMALPATQFQQIKGTRVYPAQPMLKDTVNRGQYRATRTDAATYILERQGSAKLPEIAIRWWNPQRRKLEETILPEVTLSVAANPDYRPEMGPAGKAETLAQKAERAIAAALLWLRAHVVLLAVAAIVIYLCILAGQRFGPSLAKRWRAWLEQLNNSERRYFREFRRACRLDNQDAMVSSFWKWLDRLTPDEKAASFQRVGDSSGDADFLEFAQRFARDRYGLPTGAQPAAATIYRQVARFRRHQARKEDTGFDDGMFLNPRFTNRKV